MSKDVASVPAPKVSVCVITYNQARYIGECLQSLVEQRTDFPFEILVGDDCSTDGTSDIVENFVRRHPDLVRHMRQPVNTGGSRNNNELHAAARGTYVAHMDGDDIALPGKLQTQADALDADTACTAVWHRVDFFDDVGGFCPGTTADWSSFQDGVVRFADAARLGSIAVFSALMYRRAARTPIDPERRTLDLWFTWDLLSKGHGRMLPQVLGRYRVFSSGSQTSTARERAHRLAIEHARDFMARQPERARDFAAWALCSALVDAKNRRRTALDFLRLAWDATTVGGGAGLLALAGTMKRTRAIQVRWRDRRQQPKS